MDDMDEMTPLCVQLGTTMSLTASHSELNQHAMPPSQHEFGQMATFAVPISSSSTINITVPNSPPKGKVSGGPQHAIYIPIQPPSPTPDYTTCITLDSIPTSPPTKPKPKSNQPMLHQSQSSTCSVSSSGIGSIPSSPRMPFTSISSNHDLDEDAESSMWSSIDDGRSEKSVNSSEAGSGAGVECDSACSVGSPDAERDETVTFDRVGLMSNETVAVMVQLACESDEGTQNSKFIDLVLDVTKAIFLYFRKKESLQQAMNNIQIGQLKMEDRRPVMEHIVEVSKLMGEAVSIIKADCRRVNSKSYIGTYVLHNVMYKNRGVVAKTGVIVVLRKLNKFACTKEFSEQLSLHILATRPTSLGKKEVMSNLHAGSNTSTRGLLEQRFYCDQTCTVHEASRRSFVEISDFVLTG